MEKDSDIIPTLGREDAVMSSRHDEKDEKNLRGDDDGMVITSAEEAQAEADLDVTEADMLRAQEGINQMSLERTKKIAEQLYDMHQHDQNFPHTVLERIQEFLGNPDIFANPSKHHEIINEMKVEAILVTDNSPYAEVRAVVDNTDDPTLPSLTLRVWLIGIIFSGIGAVINQLFVLRQPPVSISSEVAQLLAYPVGRFFDRVLPDWGFHLFGTRHSLNPGRFNKKEHMLITIMTTVAFNTPYTTDIIVSQYLPQYFNQPYAAGFGYQILTTISTNFCGYGLAGLARRFLIYPSYCVWPSSLVTIALNQAFHSPRGDAPVPGPFKRVYSWSRMKLFMIAFSTMFVYFFFPGYIFTALSTFNWISWIAPNHQVLNNIVGSNNGFGINPWPTFDFNVVQTIVNPLVIPAFTTLNLYFGLIVGFFFTIGFYYSNTWNTGYLPMNSNHIFDHTGASFKVAKVIDNRGIFDNAKYQTYSQPYLAAGNLSVYFWFFANYAATISYTFLFHRKEIAIGFKRAIRHFSWRKQVAAEEDDDLTEDIHARLMKNYKEVPEWWYFIVLAVAIITGMVGIGCYQTYTTPAVVLFGIAMALIFVIPVGLVAAITGVQVTMNVLAELIGSQVSPGNALSMNYFKAYGYITTAQALYFSNDLKLAHYLKIPPKHTFTAQIVATMVSTFVCTGILNFQLNGIPGVCTSAASFGMTCPGINTFFTAAVFWGTIGPQKNFGKGGPYKALLAGFPIGLAIPVLFYFIKKRFPKNRIVRQFHPVLLCTGALNGAPYNLSYMTSAVYMAVFSWLYVKKRYLAFWSKYNFVLAAAWTSGIAIAAIVIFFALEMPKAELNWWGNAVSYEGCEGTACRRLEVPDKGYFGPEPGTYP